MANLPGAVHFIAQAPQLHAKGLLGAVFAPQVGEVRIGIQVAVFHQVPGLVRAAGAQVHRHHHVRSRFLGPGNKLMHAHLIALGGEPCHFRAAGAGRRRANAILPAVAGNEIAPGPAHQRYMQLLDQLQGVLPEALLVRSGVAGLIDTGIDGASQMLQEGAVDTRVHLADLIIPVKYQLCLLHRFPPPVFRCNFISPDPRI